MPVDTAQFGQADLSKTETHTEAPMTQLGRTATSRSIIDHAWFVKESFEPETQRTETTNSGLAAFCFLLGIVVFFPQTMLYTEEQLGETLNET